MQTQGPDPIAWDFRNLTTYEDLAAAQPQNPTFITRCNILRLYRSELIDRERPVNGGHVSNSILGAATGALHYHRA